MLYISQLQLMRTSKPKQNHSHFWLPAYIPTALPVLRFVPYNCTNPHVHGARMYGKTTGAKDPARFKLTFILRLPSIHAFMPSLLCSYILWQTLVSADVTAWTSFSKQTVVISTSRMFTTTNISMYYSSTDKTVLIMIPYCMEAQWTCCSEFFVLDSTV